MSNNFHYDYAIKASVLIKALQQHIDEYGDTPVHIVDSSSGHNYDFSYGIDEDPDCENNDFWFFID